MVLYSKIPIFHSWTKVGVIKDMRKYIAGDELISKVHGHGPKNGILREAAKKKLFF